MCSVGGCVAIRGARAAAHWDMARRVTGSHRYRQPRTPLTSRSFTISRSRTSRIGVLLGHRRKMVRAIAELKGAVLITPQTGAKLVLQSPG
jgi:hypothetical protein